MKPLNVLNNIGDLCQAGFNITVNDMKRNKHRYLTWAGLGFMAVSVISACVATSEKLPVIMDDHEFALSNAYKKPTEEEQKKEVFITYRDTVIDLTKTFALSAAAFAAGTFCILKSDKIQEELTNSLLQECAMLKLGWDSYRDYIRRHHGEQADYDALNGIEREKVVEEVTDAKGKKHTEEKEVVTSSKGGRFSFFFGADTGNDNYIKGDPIHNGIFVDQTTTMLNRMLYGKRYMGTIDAETILKSYGFDTDDLVESGQISPAELKFFGIINDGGNGLEIRTSPTFGKEYGDDESYIEFNFVDLRAPLDKYEKLLESKKTCDRLAAHDFAEKIYAN